MNKKIMKSVGFSNEVKLVEQSKCPFCHKDILMGDFKDQISLDEFKISGMCQECMDEIFD